METASAARDIARLILVGGLLLLLLIGLIWAFNPSEEGGVRFSAQTAGTEESEPDDSSAAALEGPADDAAAGAAEGEGEGAVDDEAEPEAEETETETGPAAEDLIAAAPDPEATSVQVLDAGGGSNRARAARDALEDLGYNVVNVTSARASVNRTTVWFTDGSEDAGLALQARDERVTAVEPNEGLSSGVDLHLLVGPDWTDV
jgi:hypothetical protein